MSTGPDGTSMAARLCAFDLVFCLMRALALEGPLYRTIRGYRAAEAGVPKKRLPTALQVLRVQVEMDAPIDESRGASQPYQANRMHVRFCMLETAFVSY